MCTSLTFHSSHMFLARTMDYAYDLKSEPIAIPRNYRIPCMAQDYVETKYGFMGTGGEHTGLEVSDGVNERGLAIAQLYYPNEAVYADAPEPGMTNRSPHECIMWVLGTLTSVSELREAIGRVNVVGLPVPNISRVVLPLHFIVTDRSGVTVVVESEDGTLRVKDDPVGVLTNSPELEWHVKNLNNYPGVQPVNHAGQHVDGHEIKPFGQGSGSLGLPGGFTPPERFVRTVFQRAWAEKNTDPSESVNTILHILNGVTITRGVNVMRDGRDDYTQYRSVLDVTELTYYYNPYDSQALYTIRLTDELIRGSKPVRFPVRHGLKTIALN